MKAPTGFGGPGCVPRAVGTTGARDSSESHAAGTPSRAASAIGMLTTTVAARSGLVPPVAKAPQRAASAKCMLTTTSLGRAYVAAPAAKGQPSVASARGGLPKADAACAGYIPPTAKGLQGPESARGTLTSTGPGRAGAPPPTARAPPSAVAATGGSSSIPTYLCKAVDASWAAERPMSTAARPPKARGGLRRAGRTPGASPGAATPGAALPAYLRKAVVTAAPPAEREEVSCHLDFAHGEGSARKRVRFADGKGPRGGRPVDDPLRCARRSPIWRPRRRQPQCRGRCPASRKRGRRRTAPFTGL